NIHDQDGNPVTGPADVIVVHDGCGDTYAGGNCVASLLAMTREDKRALIEAVFGTPLRDGKPAGVYVAPAAGAQPYRSKGWTFSLRGWLEFERVMPCARG